MNRTAMLFMLCLFGATLTAQQPRTAQPAPPPGKQTVIAIPASASSAYLGSYEMAPGLELDVTRYEGTLFVRSSAGGAAVKLLPKGKNVFFAKDGDARITFTRDAKGAVSGLVIRQNGRDRTARKVR